MEQGNLQKPKLQKMFGDFNQFIAVILAETKQDLFLFFYWKRTSTISSIIIFLFVMHFQIHFAFSSPLKSDDCQVKANTSKVCQNCPKLMVVIHASKEKPFPYLQFNL